MLHRDRPISAERTWAAEHRTKLSTGVLLRRAVSVEPFALAR